MKNRTGFVSNSSSSSFIITAKANDKGKVLINVDLSKLGGKVCNTESQFKKEYADQGYDYDPDDPECGNSDYAEEAKLYKQCIDEIKQGRSVVIGSIDREMEGILQYVGGDCKVLEQDGYIN